MGDYLPHVMQPFIHNILVEEGGGGQRAGKVSDRAKSAIAEVERFRKIAGSVKGLPMITGIFVSRFFMT